MKEAVLENLTADLDVFRAAYRPSPIAVQRVANLSSGASNWPLRSLDDEWITPLGPRIKRKANGFYGASFRHTDGPGARSAPGSMPEHS